MALQRANHLAAQPARRRHAQPSTDDLAEQWVVEPDVDSAVLLGDADQPAVLGLLDGIHTGDAAQRVQVERLAERQQPQRVQHIVGQLIDPAVEQRGQLRRDGRPATQLPHAANLTQRARLQRALDQMPHEQRVAAGRLPHQVGGQTLHPAAERRLDQRHALLLGERHQMKALQIAVLPQRCDRVGNRLSGPDGGHNAHRAVQRQLMQQRCRQLVKQMRIVDADHRMSFGQNRFARRRQECDRIS